MNNFNVVFIVVLGLLLFSTFAQEMEPAPQSLEPQPAQSPTTSPTNDIITKVTLGLNIALMVVGFVWVIFGFRYFDIILFVAGFVVFYFITYQLLDIYVSQSIPLWAMYVIAAIIGLIGGSLFILKRIVGTVLFAALFGILFGLMLFASTPLGNIQFPHTWYQLLIILGCGIIPGGLAIWFPRYIKIVSTSFNGSFLVFHVIDSMWIHTPLSTLLMYIFRNITNPVHQFVDVQNWAAYVLLASILLLTAFGVFIQYRLTATGGDKDKDKDKEQQHLLYTDV